MKIAVIYHDADFDGKLSNEVCRWHLPHHHPQAEIHSYGWDYGRPLPTALPEHPAGSGVGDWAAYDQIYIVDLSVDELMAREDLFEKIRWIDHHASAIAKWGERFQGYRIDGVAACRLCWQWFQFGKHGDDYPEKRAFIDRALSEPKLLRLAGEYDIWDLRDPDALPLQFGLREISKTALAELISHEFNGVDDSDLYRAINAGKTIKSYCDRNNSEYARDCAHTLNWEGLCFCALNIGQRGNSQLLDGGLKPEHQACFAWRFIGPTGNVMVSLYHVSSRTDLDLSKIAVKYGGGGHKGACGFRLTLQQLAAILTP